VSTKLSMTIGDIGLRITDSDTVYLEDSSGDSVYVGDDVFEAKRNLVGVVDALESYGALRSRNVAAFKEPSDA